MIYGILNSGTSICQKNLFNNYESKFARVELIFHPDNPKTMKNIFQINTNIL